MLNENRYREIEEIQSSNGIVVYKAFDLNYDRYVAYKTLDTYSNHHAEELLLREYKNISNFDDDRVINLVEFKQGAELALITEFVEGENLSNLIQRGHLHLNEKVEIAKKIVEALAVIHNYHLIHKDINPSNIIWNGISKKAVIIDFNLSIRSNSQKVSFAQPKHLQGTLPYVSPEQTGRMNRTVDYRSDIYSLGVTLYELFASERPFIQEDYLSLIHAHLAIKAQPLADKIEYFPKNLSDIVDKMLKKNVNERYQSLKGLLYDLDNYRSDEFVLASSDHFETLILPDKVYGRDIELTELKAYWQETVQASKKMVFVSGKSGVGKTTFIKELYHRVSLDQGYFFTGKFTQASQDSYHVIRSIILEFLNVLLMEKDDYIEEWKKNFNRSNISILLSLVPELGVLLEEEDHTFSDNFDENRNRYIAGLVQFFKSISNKEHPVVIFLDDLQWMDYSSRIILEEILSSDDIKYMMIVGAYRQEALDKSHTLQLFIDKLSSYEAIRLDTLEFKYINEILEDAFSHSQEEIADAVYRKSAGNPFYIKQLLYRMYEEKCIYYKDTWHYDLSCVKKVSVSENVAELLKDKMLAFDLFKQQILFASSCIGYEFDIRILANLLVVSEDELMRQLDFLEQEDMIVSLSRYQYVYNHDQIHFAAYQLGDKVPVHIKIAKLLHSKSLGDVMSVASHLSVAMKQGIKPDFPELKDVLLSASEKAMNQMKYTNAIFYYEYMLEKVFVQYSKKIVILNNLVKLYYQVGDFEKLDETILLAKKLVESPYDLVDVYTLEINSYLDRQMQDKGVKTTIQALNDFGIKLSIDVSMKDYEDAMAGLMEKLDNRSIESLLYLPLMKNKSKMKEMTLLAGMIPLLFNLAPQILLLVIIQMLELSIDYGNCPESAFGYSFFGTIISGSMGMIKEGVAYGQLALDLVKKLKVPFEKPKVNMVVGQHIMYLSTHFNKSLELLEEGYNLGVEYGDYAYAGYSGHAYCNLSFIAGRQLFKLRDRFDIYTSSLLQMNQGNVCLFQYIYQEAINKLIDMDDESLAFKAIFDESVQVAEMEKNHHVTGLLVYHFSKMYIAYIFKHYQLAFTHAKALGACLEGGTGLIHVYLYYEYMALIRLKLFGDDPDSLKVVDECIDKLSGLKTHLNFRHRCLILSAERKAVLGDETAINDYEAALKEVVSYRYINDEAVYRERLSEYYLSIEHFELSSYYLNTAYKAYNRWGAVAKAKKLIHTEGFKSNVTTINNSVSSDIASRMDMQSILKLNQFIAKEINIESLMKNTLYVLLENAGATKAILISYDNQRRVASIDTDFDYQMNLDDVALPDKVINYVLKSKKIVRLGQATHDDLFRNDDYLIKNNIQSLLVYPLIVQNEVNGMVILENDMVEDVFSKERTEFLSILSSQITISLQNAIHYSQLEALVSERTKDLIEKNKELELLNQKLKHMSVTDGLTGLTNRRSLDEELLNEYDRFIRYQEEFSIMIMDVDRFKLVNDVHGHLVGDRILKRIANVLTNVTRAVDIVGRWGGEEFLVICPNTDLNEARQVAEKIRAYIASLKFVDVGQVTCSIGVSCISNHMAIKDLVKDADDKLYQSKSNGRNRVT